MYVALLLYTAEQLPLFVSVIQVVLRLGGETTPPLDVHLVSGISALQCVPLLGRTVTIPYIRGSLTVRGVNDLLDFQRGYFRMPDHHSDLFPSLSAADNLGDDD